MKAKPIIFSTDMVKAILDGRKTQTRRVIKPQPTWGKVITEQEAKDRALSGFDPYGFRINTPTLSEAARKAPYQPGDILWVRETWQYVDESENSGYVYKASENGKTWEENTVEWTWRPSIHMPWEAARLLLKVTDVWPERVQDISEADAKAEGVTPINDSECGYRGAFRELWNALNAKRGYDWYTNNWVWVYTFERITKEEGEHGH
jgi:hypothetical protein